jgi:hypothetical protein
MRYFMVSFLVLIFLQSCSVSTPKVTHESIWGGTYLNRVVEEENVKPFERVAVVVDYFNVPNYLGDQDFIFHKFIKEMNENAIPTTLLIKDYGQKNADRVVATAIQKLQPSHVIYVNVNADIPIGVESFRSDIFFNIDVENYENSKKMWRGKLVLHSRIAAQFNKALTKTFIKDGLLTERYMTTK